MSTLAPEVKSNLEQFIDQIIESAGFGITYWADSMKVDEEQVLIHDAEDDQEALMSRPYILESAQKWARRWIDRYTKNGEYTGPQLPKLILDENWDRAACEMDALYADYIIQIAALGDIYYG